MSDTITEILKESEAEYDALIKLASARVDALLRPLLVELHKANPAFEGVRFGMGTHIFLGETLVKVAYPDGHKDKMTASDCAYHPENVADPQCRKLLCDAVALIDDVNCDDIGTRIYYNLTSIELGSYEGATEREHAYYASYRKQQEPSCPR